MSINSCFLSICLHWFFNTNLVLLVSNTECPSKTAVMCWKFIQFCSNCKQAWINIWCFNLIFFPNFDRFCGQHKSMYPWVSWKLNRTELFLLKFTIKAGESILAFIPYNFYLTLFFKALAMLFKTERHIFQLHFNQHTLSALFPPAFIPPNQKYFIVKLS